MKIAILGAGSWGAVLGQLLYENGSEVCLWHLEADFVDEINQTHKHPFLPNIQLSKDLHFTASLDEIAEYGDMMVLAIPSQVLRKVLIKFPKGWKKPVISVSKGIENKTGMRMSQVISETLSLSPENIIVLSGPSHAEEVAQKYPTAIVAACLEKIGAKEVQSLFSNKHFRVYTSIDVVGVEFGGAAKNIIALAVGICNGLGFGDNTMAALCSRGLEEIARLGTVLGAERSTFSGLSGFGDLIVTAYSSHSRNRQVGIRIGTGEKLNDIISDMDMVAEGVETTRSIYDLSRQKNIEMPICEKIYQVLFENISPRQVILELMGRELVDEHTG